MTSTLTLSFLSLCCVALQLQPTRALNLDSLSPTVVNSGVLEGSGTGFGWTQAQHVFGDGRKGVLVSAPTSDGTEAKEGGVYSCPFDVSGSCEVQDLFLNRTVVKSNQFLAGLQVDPLAFQGQLMGYSLKSCGGVVMACAPLYVQTIASTPFEGVNYFSGNPSGRCIILNSDLNTTAQAYRARLGDLMLAGLDIEILKDGEDRGFVLSNSFASTGAGALGGQLILSDSVLRDEISSNQRTNIPVVSVDSLYGYHLESGQFTQLGVPEIVTSSPRSINHFGQVEVVVSNNLVAGAVRTFTGEEADGYFGYDFAVLDLGHGGYNSLAVGCPLCNREMGRVYIYTHTGDPNAPLVETIISPPPSSSARGRFGLAVENIGDIDLDGLSDLAVSAPYEEVRNENGDVIATGRVYIYRGSRSGVVADDVQMISAASGSGVFGYSLSGGMDVDDNGYPDLTVTDLSGGRVTTLRASPLANVTLVIPDQQDVLDIAGSSDLLCPLDGIVLHCFNITPCFFYEPKQGDIPRIALQYDLTVDSERSRVRTYTVGSEGAVLGSPEIKGREITVSGPGRANMVCGDTVTFALNPNFADADSIPVRLSARDALPLLSLEPDPELARFGAPLHPIIMRYIEGDVPAPLTLEYEIASNINCSFGDDLSLCEGEFSLVASDIIQSTQSTDGRLLLASSNEFGFQLDITNVAEDTAVNPVLIIELPQQTRLSRTMPDVNCNFLSGNSGNNGTTLECDLKNPTAAGELNTLTAFFLFNDTSVLLGVEELVILFSVRDGGTGRLSEVVSRSIGLDAVSDYNLALTIAQAEYRATRSAVVFPNVSALNLDQLGPQVTFVTLLQNSRTASTGTAFPRSTLYIHVPKELVTGDGEVLPLLVPFDVVINHEGSNCSQFQAISDLLPLNQRPTNFLPPWSGPPPPVSPECEQDGLLRCGTIICTIISLLPLPEPPTEVTVFARLYSPSIDMRHEGVAITSEVTSDTDLPRIGDASIQMAKQEVTFSPGPREAQRDCIRYWVVVVSVVIGIFALVIIIIVLAMCGVFRRWYKDKREEELDGVEQTDQELTYQRRTIPPLPQLTNGAPSSPPPEEWQKDDLGLTDKELEKDREAEEELQQEIRRMGRGEPLAHSSPTPGSNPDSDIGEGLETDL